VAITGPNGGGKSTLAKVIAGIYTPTQGKILFNGEDITGLGITERARKGISFAFQQPVRFKGLTVKDLITLASGKDINVSEACSYLSEVGLCAKDYIDREVDASLSGGELKRIEIATIMARGTSLSVFDEPEAGIDLWSFSNLIQVFERLHPHHFPPGAHSQHRRPDYRLGRRQGHQRRPPEGRPAHPAGGRPRRVRRPGGQGAVKSPRPPQGAEDCILAKPKCMK
jgi:ABC-type phosphate/phosphonate transport system ATPase subunit